MVTLVRPRRDHRGGLLAGACSEKKEVVAPPPPEALVTEVVRRDVPVQRELVGQTKGSQDMDIRARVEGFLDEVGFTEGPSSTKGSTSIASTQDARGVPRQRGGGTRRPRKPGSRKRRTT